MGSLLKYLLILCSLGNISFDFKVIYEGEDSINSGNYLELLALLQREDATVLLLRMPWFSAEQCVVMSA